MLKIVNFFIIRRKNKNLKKIEWVQNFIDQNVESRLFRDGYDVFIEKETHFIDVELFGYSLLVFLENLPIRHVFDFEFHLLEKLSLRIVVIFCKMVNEKLWKIMFLFILIWLFTLKLSKFP